MTRLSGEDNNRSIIVIVTIVAAALIGLAIWSVSGKPSSSDTSVGTKDKPAVFELKDVSSLGEDSAPVKVVVVEDFKCPACKSFEENVKPLIVKNYVDTGKVKIYTMIMPFLAELAKLDTDDSKIAAQGGKCAYDVGGNKAFHQYKSIVFRAQGPENEAWATKDRLKELSASVEMDSDKFAECLDSDATAGRVDAEEEQVKELGVSGTPSVFVNGVKVTNGQYQVYADAIDEALKGDSSAGNEP